MATIAEPTTLHPDHVSHDYVVFLGVAGMMTLIATVCVFLRFTSRKLTLFWSWDDWAVLGALVFAYGFLTCTALVATVGGAGYPINQYSLPQLEKYLQIALANNVIYNASISLSKASVLLLYCRIFTVDRSLLFSTRVVGGFLVGYFLSAACGLIFAYSPVEAQWKVWLPHTSINDKMFWLSMAIINILLDVIILCLPQARVWKLHLSTTRKVLLSLVFMLGAFVCVVSIVRIVSLLTVDIANLTYTLTVPGIWTLVELNMSIICSCLPVLPSLIRYWRNGAKSNGSKAPTGTTRPSLLRSSRKDKSTGYTDLEGTGIEYESLSGQGIQTSIESTFQDANYALAPLGQVHVQRELEVEY